MSLEADNTQTPKGSGFVAKNQHPKGVVVSLDPPERSEGGSKERPRTEPATKPKEIAK